MDSEPSLFIQDPWQQAYAMSGKRRRTSSDNVTQKRARFTAKHKEEEKSRLLKSLQQTKTQVKRKYGEELDDLEALEFQMEHKRINRQREMDKMISESRVDSVELYEQTLNAYDEEGIENLKGLKRIYYDSIKKCYDDEVQKRKELKAKAIKIDDDDDDDDDEDQSAPSREGSHYPKVVTESEEDIVVVD